MTMKMRRTESPSSVEEGRALLERAPVVHLAMIGADGQPILRSVHGVLDGDLFAFHDAAAEKLEGLGRPAGIAAYEIVAEIPSGFPDLERGCPATTYHVSVQASGVLEVAGLRLNRITCTAELGQERPPEERGRVIEQLWRRGGPGDARAVDTLVRRFPELLPAFLRTSGLRLGCGLEPAELDEVASLLDGAYWLDDVPRELRIEAIRSSSAVVTARDENTGQLVAFARAVSDRKVAWIYDVMVASEHRGTGAGTTIVKLLLDHPSVRGARIVRLATRDAASFYHRFGFMELTEAPRRYAWRPIEMVMSARFAPNVPSSEGPA
jgi:GNAT superfamily N-acetyltransferase